VEFGIFIQGYTPRFRRDADPDAEHHSLMTDVEVAKAADGAGFKYVWTAEHHFLDEYSHLSANDALCGYLAHSTTRIHIGSGIFNPLPKVNHPAKVAERVAMLDHLSDGRFEFGTGRGAGSHEILGFLPGLESMSGTRPMWEDVIGEFAKMWLQEEYPGYQGEYWSLPPRKVLPKPWKKPHPPMWYACGNPTSYEMCGRRGLGVLGFSVMALDQMQSIMTAYKNAIPNAEPVGAYVNDNIMVTTGAIVTEDPEEARRIALNSNLNYFTSQLYRYHDTFPRPEGIPPWPEIVPPATREALDIGIQSGTIVGDPDHAIAQARRWEAAGADQLVFGTGTLTKEQTLETIRLFGKHVIPKIDTDPVHRTTRQREAAAATMAASKPGA
jgi:alkanesulfonate monooxygenase SsuD/methylene tetrahydromethanopterin reductase-like flavin-dependent oxidoreductase (luciferase family)